MRRQLLKAPEIKSRFKVVSIKSALKLRRATQITIERNFKSALQSSLVASQLLKLAQLLRLNSKSESTASRMQFRNAKAAVEEGIVAGGGVALLQAAKLAFAKLKLEGDEATGAKIVELAVEAPLKQIAINAGLEGGVVVEKVRHLDAGFGLNAATGEYVDMIKAGIIDPAKVTRSALQNAASIAALFLTTEAVIAEKPEPKSAAPAAPGGGDMDF